MSLTNKALVSNGPVSASQGFSPGEGHHTHVVQFYSDDAPLLDALSRYIGPALAAGDAAIVIATKAHRDGLASLLLNSRGLDTSTAAKQGRYIPLDAEETLSKFMLEGWPDQARFAALVEGLVTKVKAATKGGNPRVVGFGEMVSLLWSQGKYDAAIQLEDLWNEAIKTHSLTIRCAYPIAGFDREEHAEQFLKICAKHSSVIPGESYTDLISEDERHRDISNLQRKAQALETEIAERKKAQKALKAREFELSDLLENALEGVQRTGPDQRIVWANKALLKLLGYAAEDYIGHHLAEFFVHGQTFAEFWTKLMRKEEVYNLPAELKCKDGSIRQVLINSNGLWDAGQFIHTRTFIHDVTERMEMEQALKLAHDELEMRVMERTAEINEKNVQMLRQAEMLAMTNDGLRALSARLFQVQDEERRRIARDLHDSTGQALALLSMNLSVLEVEASGSSPNMAKALSDNGKIVRQISTELRTLSYLLHPPLLEEMGLQSALRWYIEGFGQRSNIKVNLELPDDLGRLPRDMEIAIFRITQECLTNIHRHAESPTAIIRLHYSPERATLAVKDEGKGIAQDQLSMMRSSGAAGVGIRGMQERVKNLGGELEIVSDSTGTEIKVVIPMPASRREFQSLGA